MAKESLKDILTKFFENKITVDDYPIKDKASYNDLVKLGINQNNVKRGSQHYARQALDKVLSGKGITIDGVHKSTKSTGLIGDMEIGIKETLKDVKSTLTGEPKPEAKPAESSQSSYGIFGSGGQPTSIQQSTTLPTQATTTPQPELKKPLDPNKKAEYERLFETTFDKLVVNTYVQLGFVEGEAEPDKPVSEKSFREDVKGLSHDWANYCFTHNIELPTWIELAGMVLATVSVFGAPLVKVMVSGRKKKKSKSNELESAEKITTEHPFDTEKKTEEKKSK